MEVKIKGIVQGVGFRPFIHRLVREHGLRGTIRNTSSGVTLELEGERAALERFLQVLPREAPSLAVIEEIRAEERAQGWGHEGFRILGSEREAERNTLISPDIGICPDCLRELSDPGDRRYRYPFINCTNCGPRFTIIEDVPYDRARTSMKRFPMCPDCAREYRDIENRRYHAQPDCCPVCGPALSLLDAEGNRVPGDALTEARRLLKEGKILAVKGLGGFHLACRCDDPAIATELRRRKHRDEKPFALMCADVDAARTLCLVDGDEERILTGARRPIVLLRKRPELSLGLSHLSENGCVGVMLPYTPLHVLLFEDGLDMLILTSANISDLPILKDNGAALRALRGIADGYLLHDREIRTRCDDSLCWVVDGAEYFARRSRGYAPQPVTVPRMQKQLLACGAEQKASFCLGKGEHAFLSQHIGDLKNLETLEHYERQIRHFERLFDVRPSALACDLHPDYLSGTYAQERAEKEGLPLVRVQHHHAHMASCMADNRLEGPCIGLVWDGTGLGTDGSIWGAECLIGDYGGVERFGSILPIPLIGGDRAVMEPYRVAYALLRLSGCDREDAERFLRKTSESREGGSPEEWPVKAEQLERQVAAGLNCPLSSGMGRLFDGTAALLGLKSVCNYEGQGAILLETAAGEGRETEDGFPVAFTEDAEGILRFDWRPMIRALREERDAGVPADVLASRFMDTLLAMAAETALLASEKNGLRRVVLSGGSFQNQYLMRRLPAMLRARGLEPYWHRRVSCNDEGLSLGQLMIAERATGQGAGG